MPRPSPLIPFEILQNSEVFHEAVNVLMYTLEWSKISPAIFGSMFQGIMDPEERREIGAHYTSEENILKVINPLFMDDLWAEFERVKSTPKKLEEFHEKIASLRILDPACGCGNFLITTYKELRRLELEIIKMKYPSRQRLLDVSPLIKVSIEQFYGIEILEFPCEVARTGMWLVEHLMNREVGEWFGMAYADLPLKRSAHIYCENALRRDWQELLKDDKDYSDNLNFDYIIGNPPYVGYTFRNKIQQDDIDMIFGAEGKNLDYIAAWFKKAADIMQNEYTRTAFVSTNSVTQGEQVTGIWKPILESGIKIEFGYETFKWWNEGRGKAAVHCVIVGFSKYNRPKRLLYLYDNKKAKHKAFTATNINAYLVDAPNIFIQKRTTPICTVPIMNKGSQPTDGGHLLMTKDEMETLISEEPESKQFIHEFLGSEEYINRIPRYCLWLQHVDPNKISKCPNVLKRIEAVRKMRLESKKATTRKWAEQPMLFTENRQPSDNYIIVPSVSSETRKYIPIGFLSPDVIASNLVLTIPNATLYHFGILTSSVHMAWMRAVCGRLEMRYRYSATIVYNNFPWPDLNGSQGIGSAKIKKNESNKDYQNRMEAKISLCAEEILRARDGYPESSLAQLYHPLNMPQELFKAHKALDKAVMELYGYSPDMSEPEIVADLMVRYQKLVDAENSKNAAETAASPGSKSKRSRKKKTDD